MGRDEFSGDVPVGVGKGSSELAVSVDRVIDDVVLVEKSGPVVEHEVDAHVVVGKSSGGESNSGVTGVEEGKGEIEGRLRDGLTRSVDVGEVGESTNHLVVSINLARGRRESAPEVKVHRRESGGHKVVEGDATLEDQVVQEIGGPPDVDGSSPTGGTGSTLESLILDGGDDYSQPRVEKIITGTRDLDRPFLTELGGAGGTAENDGHLGEPSGLAGLTNEVGGSFGATVHVLLKLIVSSEIDEAGCKIGCANTRHFFLL